MSTLIGHQKIQAELHQLAENARFPHAILLHGEKGIGKRKLAEALAAYLLCAGTLEEGRLTPQSNHPILPQIAAGSCADYLVLEKEVDSKGKEAGNIKVEQARELLGQLSLRSSGRRVIIVDAADELGMEAANTLLKNLEEPGQNIHFIVLAHNLFRVMPTILSRCRKMRVDGLQKAETLQVLQQTENLSPEEAEVLATQMPHSPGQALHLGQEGVKVNNLLLQALHGDANPIAVAESVSKSKQAPLALTLLQQHIANRTKADLTLQSVENQQQQQAVDAYQTLQTLQQRLESHNLTPSWVVEQALRTLQPLWQK